jgi:Tfp pilus assembly protein PilP
VAPDVDEPAEVVYTAAERGDPFSSPTGREPSVSAQEEQWQDDQHRDREQEEAGRQGQGEQNERPTESDQPARYEDGTLQEQGTGDEGEAP